MSHKGPESRSERNSDKDWGKSLEKIEKPSKGPRRAKQSLPSPTLTKDLKKYAADLRYTYGTIPQHLMLLEAAQRIDDLEGAMALIEGHSKDEWAKKIASDIMGQKALK